jgi:2-iminobutanoate/2-iminopropanoate deaminase
MGLAIIIEKGCRELSGWCGRRESNPQGYRRGILSPLCLPIPPRPLGSAARVCHKVLPKTIAARRFLPGDLMIDRIETGIAPSSAPISDAVRAGKHVWLVAIAEDPITGDIVTGGIEAQARRCIENLDIGIKAAGGTLRNLVMVQIFLTDSADAAGMNAVYREFFTEQPYPVRATVVVKELLAKGLRIEMTATGVLD